MNEIKNGYDNVYGTWRVTTEGDVRARTKEYKTVSLPCGTYELLHPRRR